MPANDLNLSFFGAAPSYSSDSSYMNLEFMCLCVPMQKESDLRFYGSYASDADRGSLSYQIQIFEDI